MSDRSVDHLTLREMFTAVERHTRELIDHLEKGFLPKAHTLLKFVRGGSSDPTIGEVEDLTIVNSAARLQQDEAFTEGQYQRLEVLFSAIRKNVIEVIEA